MISMGYFMDLSYWQIDGCSKLYRRVIPEDCERGFLS